jgi:ribonuclease HI
MSNPFIRIQNLKHYKLNECHLLRFDGGAVPNPGACGSGAVLYAPDGTGLCERGEFIRYGTNNIAEYTGLKIGLEMARKRGIRAIKIEGDSKLVIQQICSLWAIKAPGLLALHAGVMEEVRKFDYVVCRHIYREQNEHADALTNELQETRTSFERDLS